MRIEINEDSFSKLRTRYDKDMTLYYLDKYVLRGTNNKPIPNSTSITLNDARVFGDTALFVMGQDKMKFNVTSIDNTFQKEVQEDYKSWLFYNDIQLENQSIESLKSSLDFFILFRGAEGGVVLMMKDKDRYLPTITPVDPRWATWEYGTRRLKRGSYRTRMNRLEAEEKFSKSFGKQDYIEVGHVFDENNYYVVPTTLYSKINRISGEPLDTNTHNMGFCPFIMTPATTSPMLISATGDYGLDLSRWGESIYAPVRDNIYDMMEFASVWASLNKQQFLAPMVYKGNRKDFGSIPTGWGTILMLRPNEIVEELRKKDFSPASQQLFHELFARWERATLAAINYGQAGERMSALMGAQLKGDKEKIFGCRKKAHTVFYRQAHEMLWRQIATGKCYNTKLRDDEGFIMTNFSNAYGEKKSFIVNITFSSVSPEESIQNMQAAGVAKSVGYSKIAIFRDVIQSDDPDGMMRESKIDEAEQRIPELGLLDAAVSLASGKEPMQEKINTAKSLIIFNYLEKTVDATLAGTISQLKDIANPASQPNITEPVSPQASSQKKAKAMMKATGNTVEQQGMTRTPATGTTPPKGGMTNA